MEEILKQFEEGEGLGKTEPFSHDDASQALNRFVEALRQALPFLEGEEKIDEPDDAINPHWLLNLVKTIPSELSSSQLARSVLDASHLKDEGQQQEALFNALGASEEAMNVLFQIAPNIPEIKRNIRYEDFGETAPAFSPVEYLDEEEMERQRLRQEAFDAAHVAALAKAEADSIAGSGGVGHTHSITRSSDVEAQKAARKAAKRATQALQRAKAAGAIIEESELLEVDASVMGHGGLMGQSQDQLRELQQMLLPEGSRKHYDQQGLPNGTEREENDAIGYERVTIPAPVLDASKLHPRLKIDDVIDQDCAIAFGGVDSLNPMQSTVFETAFNRRENMLVCAPTGAGKTNVAMLTLTAHFRDVGLIGSGEGSLDASQKVVYIAPMKALAQEVVEKYSRTLKPLGLIVRELTGDMQLTRAEAQSADVLVTTPEKWDVVTRKSGNDENSLGNQCGLLIIDEVHLLADERGAVIESVVSRLHRLVESRQKQLRIVGLSATLPNYQDVAEFLQVPDRGLFFFGPEHRPVPLQQQFVGVYGNVKKRYEIEEKMNDVCYETVQDSLARGYQVMVFVHSRKGTSDAASALAQRATASNELERYFVTQGKEGPHGDAYKRFVDRVKKSRNREVSTHFYNGMGIHHAGMLRGDRKLSESMFADGAIKVLCCTATLAWGVNLPAHTVIVKGTDVYNPEKGKNIDLSILDVQQIFGRAGRPQFDTSGEATLITNHAAMTRYLDKLVRAVPIESNFIKQLSDHLNAEIVGGTVTNINEAATWLSYTYLYVRMLKNPLAYGISADQKSDDPRLRGRCIELVRQSAEYLSTNKMINYHAESGNLSMTTLGRVAAHFYIQAESVTNFNEAMELRPSPTDAQLLRMVSTATEFENVRVRQEEQKELDSLQQKCPIALEGPINDAATKTFVLMQIFISRERPKGFTLISDTNYIASNAGRVARAIFEMCLHTNRAGTALKLLRLAKSVDNQFWWFQTPLRHFENEIGINIIKAIESRHSGPGKGYGSFESALSLLDMTPEEVGQICRSKKATGVKVQKFIRMIPRPVISCKVLPVTRDVLRFQIEITPDFNWHGRWHGGVVGFWLWVEDSESQRIYHQEQIMFTKRTHPESMKLEMPIPVFDSGNMQYLIRLVADSWVGVELVYPVSLKETRMPEQALVHTDLIDLTPLPTTVLQDPKYEQLFSRIETFNPVQTQLFHVLYHTDVPVFLGAPTGSGKTVVAELAILRMKRLHKNGICVYIAPLKSLARERLNEWKKRFGGAPLNWKVLELSGDTRHDRRVLENADILVCTPEKWDLISRGWRGTGFGNSKGQADGKAFVKRVRLLVIDEIHLLGEERGAVLEAIVSRTRFISRHLEQEEKESERRGKSELVRIVGLSTAIANPDDLANWIGVDTEGYGPTAKQGLYNFRPSIRPVPTKVHVQGYPGKHYCPRMATMNKPCYAAIKQHSPDRPSLIFVASRRQTRLTAFDLISYAAADENPRAFLGCDEAYVEAIAEGIHDEALKHTITFGIGLHHAGLSVNDRSIVERMYLNGEIRVLVATATLAWGVNLPARLVIVKGTEYYDGKTSRYVDYPLTDVLQMIGRAGRPGHDTTGVGVVLVETSKKNFYKKFLYTPFPVESCLQGRMCENVNAEIATSTVKSLIDCVGYLMWTFFARRVKANPSYYGASSADAADVEEFLLSVAKDTISQLRDEKCIEVDGDMEEVDCQVKPTPLGAAASEYYLTFKTPKQMLFGVKECANMIQKKFPGQVTLRPPLFVAGEGSPMIRPVELDELSIAWLLYSLSCTHEFNELPVRHNEEILNEELSDQVMWGADTSSLLNENGRSSYIDPEIYGDAHTKCFLLIQAYLEYTRLPISDYVNDTKTVMDNVPRLLAAMHFIASQQQRQQVEGMYEVMCQLYKTKQVISTRSTVQEQQALVGVAGLTRGAIPALQKAIIEASSKGTHSSSSSSSENLCFYLRHHVSRDEAAQLLKQIPKNKLQSGGKNNATIRSILDAIYALPKIVLQEAKVRHYVDKASGESKGRLSLKLELSSEGSSAPAKGQNRYKKQKDYASLGIVLGTNEQAFLLGHEQVSLSGNNNNNNNSNTAATTSSRRVIEKEVGFDWKVANAHGGEEGGFLRVGLVHDSICGMDSELLVSL